MGSYFFERSGGGLNLRPVGSAVDVTDVRGTVGQRQVSHVTACRVGHPDRCSVVTVTRPSGLVVEVQYTDDLFPNFDPVYEQNAPVLQQIV